MADGQHKLSRRALLGAVCASSVIPAEAGTSGRPAPSPARWDPGFRRDDEGWDRALVRFREAQAVLDGARSEPDEEAYDALLDVHSDALCALCSAWRFMPASRASLPMPPRAGDGAQRISDVARIAAADGVVQQIRRYGGAVGYSAASNGRVATAKISSPFAQRYCMLTPSGLYANPLLSWVERPPSERAPVMTVAGAQLSRRALLGAVCASSVIPAEAGTSGRPAPSPARWDPGFRRDDEGWDRALVRFREAQAVLDGAPQRTRRRGLHALLDAHSEALCALLALPAPDLAGLAAKLDIIVAHLAWELAGAEDCLERVRQDARRLAAAAA
jgi:hypothetical protein